MTECDETMKSITILIQDKETFDQRGNLSVSQCDIRVSQTEISLSFLLKGVNWWHYSACRLPVMTSFGLFTDLPIQTLTQY